MSFLQLPLSYVVWHYTRAWSDLVRLYRNLAWFLWNFFSIHILCKTLLSPWKRLHETGLHGAGGFMGGLILNVTLRGVGCIARLFAIATGLFSLLLLSLCALVFLVLWLFLPALSVASIVYGAVGVAVAI